MTIAQEINLRQSRMLAVPVPVRLQKFHGPWCPTWREPEWSRRAYPSGLPEGICEECRTGSDWGEFSREVGHAA